MPTGKLSSTPAQSSDRAPAQDALSIGKLSKELGISTATINYYVTEGLLPRPVKLNRTRARYNQLHRRLLRLIKVMQAAGLSLAQIKETLDAYGRDEHGVTLLEGVGRFQPLPAARIDPDQAPVDHFDPIDRASFVQRLGGDEGLLDTLEAGGVIRPLAQGRYDAYDLRMARAARALIALGGEPEGLLRVADALPALRSAAPHMMRVLKKNQEALQRRELRVRDVLEPYADIIEYLMDRVLQEEFPRWHETVFEGGASPRSAPR